MKIFRLTLFCVCGLQPGAVDSIVNRSGNPWEMKAAIGMGLQHLPVGAAHSRSHRRRIPAAFPFPPPPHPAVFLMHSHCIPATFPP
jgi:hypothetical protein